MLALVCSICFLDYWGYSAEFHKNPNGNFLLLEGHASAPQQYRILIVRVAGLIERHTLFAFRYSFVLFDLLAGAAAGLILLKVLERSAAFRRVDQAGRWLAYAAFLFLFAYYLLWLQWYQRPETLPSTCFIAAMLGLLSWRTSQTFNLVAIAALTLLASFLQALTRADLAACFYAGVFLYAVFDRDGRLPASRAFNVCLSAAACALAVGTQWYLMHRLYPNATYGDTPVIQFRMNLSEPLRIAPFLLFMLPVFWTLLSAVRKRTGGEAAALALCCGAALFLPLWMVFGKIDEVRIFIPFAVALIPQTVAYVLGALLEPGTEATASA